MAMNLFSCDRLAAYFLFTSLILVAARCFSLGNRTLPDLSKYLSPRIIGGRNANPNEFPYHAYLNFDLPHNGFGMCGGGILSRRWVISAAHCFYDFEEKKRHHFPYHVSVGVSDIRYDYQGQSLKPSAEYIYPSKVILDYDIALIKLSEDIQFGEDVKQLLLPTGEEDTKFIGKENAVTLSGFGLTARDGDISRLLKAVNMTVLEDSKCSGYTKGKKKIGNGFVKERHICAGSLDGKKDACTGDSGGSLVGYVDKNPVILGIVSYGFKCAYPEWPGIYTRVSFYLPWIRWIMR